MIRPSQRGMTLLETLIALVILAGAMTAALSMARTAETLNAAAKNRQRHVDNAYGDSYFRALLETVAPVVRQTESGVPILDFYGAPDELDFFSTHFAEAERPLISRTRVKITDSAIVLVRGEETSPEMSKTRVLMTLAGRVKFQFGEADADGRLIFRDTWVDQARLPSVITVTRWSEPQGDWRLEAAAVPILSSAY